MDKSYKEKFEVAEIEMTAKNRKIIFFLLLIIIVAGALFRFNHLGSESIWLDEGYALVEADQPTVLGVLDAVYGPPEGTPPLYFVVLHLWMKHVGNTEFLLRLPSVIFSIISIFIIFLIGRKLYDAKTGLITALLMSLSLIQILYSQEARPYGLFVMLVLLSTLFFIDFARKGKAKDQVIYLIFTILMLYTHYLGLFVLFCQVISYFLFREKMNISLKKISASVLIIAVMYIPGIFYIFSQFIHNFYSIQASLERRLGFSFFLFKLGLFNFVWPVLIVCALVFLIYRKRERFLKFINKLFSPNVFIMLMIIFSIFYVAVVSRWTNSLFITRYSHFMYPLFYLVVARKFVLLKNNYWKKLISLLFIIITIVSLTNYSLDVPRKTEWAKAANLIEENGFGFGQEKVVVIGGIQTDILQYYYGGGELITFPNVEECKMEDLQKLKIDLQGVASFWLVQSTNYDNKGCLLNNLAAEYSSLEEYSMYKLEVTHFRFLG